MPYIRSGCTEPMCVLCYRNQFVNCRTHVETADKPTQTSEELTFSCLLWGGNRYHDPKGHRT
jgi:hypothetical protein